MAEDAENTNIKEVKDEKAKAFNNSNSEFVFVNGTIEYAALPAAAQRKQAVLNTPVTTKSRLDEIKAKLIKAGAVDAGVKMITQVTESYMKADEADEFLQMTILLFKDTAAMREYIGLKPGVEYKNEEIAKAAYRTWKEVFVARDQMTKKQYDTECGVIRRVADILMASKENPQIEGMIKDAQSMSDVDEIQRIIAPSAKVNRNVFIDTLSDIVTVKDDTVTIFDDFEIKAGDIAKALNTKITSAERANLIKSADLGAALPAMFKEERGKKTTILMDIRNQKAVTQAA